MRVAIPSGFMVQGTASAGPTMVICTGQGAMTLAVDRDGAPLTSDHHKPAKAPAKFDHCTFASAATPLAATQAHELPQPTLRHAAPALVVSGHQQPGLGLAAPPPPTTGPPILV
jgi:hypothetical protein